MMSVYCTYIKIENYYMRHLHVVLWGQRNDPDIIVTEVQNKACLVL
jgi:hypothetical protein